MTVRGNEVIFHSALSFIRMLVSVRSIFTASVICRIIVSLRYDPVTLIPNSCISPPCSSTQCLHSGDWSMFLAANLPRCSAPRVYALLAVSPTYTLLEQFSPIHSIVYVTLSVLQFPFPVVVHTKQSALPQLPVANGFDRCSSLLSVPPVLSTTLILNPLFCIAFVYILFSFPLGVDGINRTESNPPVYTRSFFLPSVLLVPFCASSLVGALVVFRSLRSLPSSCTP